VSLLAEVLRVLDRERMPHALIGAAALAIHGLSRSTADIDLLCVDATILQREVWGVLESPGRSLRILKGDAEESARHPARRAPSSARRRASTSPIPS
jgi:hypothetical protein